MRGKSVLLLVIALVCGAIASVGLTQMLNKPATEAAKVAMVKIYVTNDDVDINEEFTADNVRLEEWPKDRVPEGAVTKLENVEGMFAMHRLFKDEPVLLRKISSKRIGTEEKIPAGYRAVAVRTSSQSAVSNLLLPGSRVDVIWFVKSGDGVAQTQTSTILKDVRVFSVNTQTTRDTDGKAKGAIEAKTVTLLVKPEQVQALMLATQEGTIQFAMRKPDDSSDLEIVPPPTKMGDLLGNLDTEGSPVEENSSTPSAPANQPEFKTFLENLTNQAPTQFPSFAPSAEMVVMTPHGPPKKFEWSGNDEFPREVAFGAPPASFPTLPISAGTPPALAPAGNQPEPHAPKDSSQGDDNAEGSERDE